MSSEKKYDAVEADYTDSVDLSYSAGSRPNDSKRSRSQFNRKRSKAPTSFNGMHRRRRRKMAW